jgi:hypothetical protein
VIFGLGLKSKQNTPKFWLFLVSKNTIPTTSWLLKEKSSLRRVF